MWEVKQLAELEWSLALNSRLFGVFKLVISFLEAHVTQTAESKRCVVEAGFFSVLSSADFLSPSNLSSTM